MLPPLLGLPARLAYAHVRVVLAALSLALGLLSHRVGAISLWPRVPQP